MQIPIRLLDLGPAPYWQTQAIYHAVAELMQADTPDTIIITWPQTPYLCLGYHDVYDAVLDRAECERCGLPVVRRRVGGGTTYLDANQIFYQCIFHHTRVPPFADAIYARMLAAPVATLRRLGLNAALRDAFELEVDDHRIAGIGGGRIGEACVVVGNLLLDFDYHAMTRVWRASWPGFRELAAAALRDHLVTLRQLLGPIEMETVRPLLREEFASALGRPLQPGALTPEEIEHTSAVGVRQGSPEYLNMHGSGGQARPLKPLKIAGGVFIHAVEIELDGHMVRASLRVRDGIIQEAQLEPCAAINCETVEASLRGKPLLNDER